MSAENCFLGVPLPEQKPSQKASKNTHRQNQANLVYSEPEKKRKNKNMAFLLVTYTAQTDKNSQPKTKTEEFVSRNK